VQINTDGIHNLTYQAVDVAGRRSPPQSLTVRLDQTPPMVICSQAPPPQSSGWNNTDVTVSFTATDSHSGIATVSSPVRVSAEGANQPITGTASDKAGNSASATCRMSIDKSPPALTASASPATLWPPDGKMVPITISGTITDPTSGVSTATYAVKDEYGSVQPSGSVTLVNGSYSFTIQLQASRNGNDQDGRQYTITVSVQDKAGNQRSAATGVTVPHDQGK
jgi:Bacterial Ig-like domain